MRAPILSMIFLAIVLFHAGRLYEMYFPWGEPTAEEAARTFAAYRACIQRSTCHMTPQDWIEYYDLKWRLEESDIE